MRRLLQEHGHHLIFALSLISILLLVLWWTVFIGRSIHRERACHYASLQDAVRFQALRLGHSTAPPAPGRLREDPRLEILDRSTAAGSGTALLPHWPQYTVRCRADETAAVERAFARRRLMITGESTLMFLLVFISSILLYQYIALGRRTVREIEELWSGVTHEIKTPIAGLKAFLQSLTNPDLPRSELEAFIPVALQQVERQEQLAENLLRGARLKHKIRRGERLPLPLADTLQDYLFHRALHLRKARVHFDAAAWAGVTVWAEPQALRVILDNITHNAVKFGPEALELTVSVRLNADTVQIVFADNGEGFPPQRRELLFCAFRHAHRLPPQPRRGSGFGLHISRRLARQLGGDLAADSRGPGQGAEICLTLKRCH